MSVLIVFTMAHHPSTMLGWLWIWWGKKGGKKREHNSPHITRLSLFTWRWRRGSTGCVCVCVLCVDCRYFGNVFYSNVTPCFIFVIKFPMQKTLLNNTTGYFESPYIPFRSGFRFVSFRPSRFAFPHFHNFHNFKYRNNNTSPIPPSASIQCLRSAFFLYMKRYVVLAEPLNDGGMLCEAKSVNAIAIFGSHPPLVPLWTWQRRRVISTSCVACSEPTAGGWIEDYQGVLNWAENIRVFFSSSSFLLVRWCRKRRWGEATS